MPEKKKHHYVPKFHLRNFSIDQNGKQLKICRKQPFLIIGNGDLRSQGYVKNFYGETDEYENALADFEGVVSKIIQFVVKHETIPKKGTDEYNNLHFHTMLQNSRTKAAADDVNKLTENTIKSITKGDARFEKLGEKLVFEMDQPIFLALHALYKSLPKTEDFKLIINRSPRSFLTSDCPVLLYNQFLERRKHPGGHLGLATKGLQIIFPIHPKYALFFYDERTYNVGYKRRRTVFTEDISDIDSINLLQYLTADSVLFTNETISDHYLKKLADRSTKTPWEKEFTNTIAHTKDNGDGTYSEFYHSYLDNPSIKLHLSFVKETSMAKNFKPSGYTVELRQDNRPR